MTDKDRYGTTIGKGFAEKVRPVLCSEAEEFELEAPETTARYILKQLRKEVDLRKLLPEVRRALKEQRTFFDGPDVRQQFEQRLTGSLGGEHLLECLVRGVSQGSRFTDIIHGLTEKAVLATRDRLGLQLNYKDDIACQAGFDRHRAAIAVELHRMLLRDAGLGKAKSKQRRRKGTRGLLPLVVARAH